MRPMRLNIDLDNSDLKALQWYSESTKLIKQLYGENWKLFVDLLAATSPRSRVKKNWKIADAILKAYLRRHEKPEKFLDVLTSVFSAHSNNVIRALQGKELHGPKVKRFAENLKGNLDVVTIDVWICKAYGINQKSLTKTKYAKLEKQIKADAKRRGYHPANWQAVIWSAVRRMAGYRLKSFVSVYRSIFCETPCFAFMQDD